MKRLAGIDEETVAVWREIGEIPFDQSTVERAHDIIEKLDDERAFWRDVAIDLIENGPRGGRTRASSRPTERS